MKTLSIQARQPYRVLVGTGLLSQAGDLLAKEISPQKAIIVCDSHVAPLYQKTLSASLENASFSPLSYVFPAGEESKSLARLGDLLEFLAKNEVTRSDLLLALGGGVTGDLTGFAASIYLRGIRYIQLPTSLLAAVDSSVGGKTAINLSHGKNLTGSFWQPSMVICDTDTLDTLPEEFFFDGVAESLKYGVIGDLDLFEDIRRGGLSIHREEIITQCIAKKGELVAMDERDTGFRQLLNLGHTFGHAIEKKSGLSIRHGQAVSIGMYLASLAAEYLHFAEEPCSEKMKDALQALSLPFSSPWPVTELLPYMTLDKKRKGDNISLILPRRIGHCEIVPMTMKELSSLLTNFPH